MKTITCFHFTIVKIAMTFNYALPYVALLKRRSSLLKGLFTLSILSSLSSFALIKLFAISVEVISEVCEVFVKA
ncbi:MAG: hypothetical protein DRJ33_02435 [Candidatus Methanomethylicota archaeon]|uniref:Uncharacterized protein n=1 Tax=Thermoproteota archaeon TaxID=2056631 RepID=A0A497EZU4_9CREN|nr:MAG: hypothetical protein DRJ33_02435 [Candidatus Verstraetearchaeota archaeon]